jgi:hypothetical protein
MSTPLPNHRKPLIQYHFIRILAFLPNCTPIDLQLHHRHLLIDQPLASFDQLLLAPPKNSGNDFDKQNWLV